MYLYFIFCCLTDVIYSLITFKIIIGIISHIDPIIYISKLLWRAGAIVGNHWHIILIL